MFNLQGRRARFFSSVVFLLLNLRRFSNVRVDAETRTFRVDVERDGGETAIVYVPTPYRIHLATKVIDTCRYLRTGSVWGGYI